MAETFRSDRHTPRRVKGAPARDALRIQAEVAVFIDELGIETVPLADIELAWPSDSAGRVALGLGAAWHTRKLTGSPWRVLVVSAPS